MSHSELLVIIEDRLTRFGAQESARLAIDLRVPESAVKACFRKLGAYPRKFGDWPKTVWNAEWKEWTKPSAMTGPCRTRCFTMWSLTPWKSDLEQSEAA